MRKERFGKMYRYVAFDVETPNRFNNRMSAIGISVIEDGAIRDNYFSYVNPEARFDYFNTKLTGIDERTVRNAPAFPELWKEIEPIMSGGILVAHNAVFDLGVLKKCLQDYGISWKPSGEYCSLICITDSMTFVITTGSAWTIIRLTATAMPALRSFFGIWKPGCRRRTSSEPIGFKQT